MDTLRVILARKKSSVAQLSRESGLSINTIKSLLDGVPMTAKVRTIIALCNHAGLDFDMSITSKGITHSFKLKEDQ